MNKENYGKFLLIVTPGFRENSGGAIVLHLLCHILNEKGIVAKLWHTRRPYNESKKAKRRIFFILNNFLYILKRQTVWRRKFQTNPEWNTPEHSEVIPKDAWVLYPDIIHGNPLQAKKVIRWYLHYRSENKYDNRGITLLKEYYYSENFAPKNQLFRVLSCTWRRDDLFNESDCNPRILSCHMWRKRDSDLTPIHSSDSICLDGLSNVEIAKIFKKSHTFISYDLHTAYSTYAALCGCLSIVARKTGLSEIDWRPDEWTRYGVAYGFESSAWAIRTAEKLKEVQNKKHEKELGQLDEFIRDLFGNPLVS